MHIFNAGGFARWGPVPFMKKTGGFFCLRGTGGDDLHGSRLDSRLKSRVKPTLLSTLQKIYALTFDFT